MILPTRSQLPSRPPLMAVGNGSEMPASFERLRMGVGLGSADDMGLLNLRGQDAGTFVRQVYGVDITLAGAAVRTAEGVLACLRPYEFVLLSPHLQETLDRLQAIPSSSLLTITDVTHGRGLIVLAGARAANVLPKMCGLNFSDTAFPDLHAAQTMLAKVRALIIRADQKQIPVYTIVVDRSLTAYVWDVLVDAAQEYDGFRLNISTLQMLRG